ncbi:MAG: efflux RND transporter permease subunit [Armatimonadota bacterium]|nr:efflux RND transporter permease subunit [Armatimonadota bacterium]MDR7455248.1 efflux RND transporter permease subunit [Armatimonadota bacterium]MDR7496558.1 efflux RND transporter permease subunit [Armatimonadota bacterium]
MSISRAAIARPVTTAMAFLAVSFLGLVAFSRLPVDLMPDISFPSLSVQTNYPGAGPQEVEREVTMVIEDALAAIPGMTELVSSSTEGRSSVTLRFAWGADLDAAANEVRPALDRIRGRLPSGAETPRLSRFDPNTFPIMLLAIEATGDTARVRDLAEREFKPRLEQVEGVALVEIRGTRDRQIQVQLDAGRMAAFGISEREVTQALAAAATADPGGDVRVGAQRRIVRTLGRFASPDDIAMTVVTTRGGVPVRIADVARVVDGLADATSITRLNGRPAIIVAVTKQSGSNTVAVARRVRAVVDELNAQFPQGRMTILNDGSRFIRRAISNVQTAALAGGALTIAVLLTFLRNLSSTLIIATAIPASILATIFLMFTTGSTLNLMTFGGLALAVGMLVDSAIVVLENIFRHREEGQPARLAAEASTAEVGTAIMASTLTTIVVFLPMFFTTGIASVMFRPLALVVTAALLCSLLVAITLIPTLSARALIMGHGRGAAGRLAAAIERRFNALDDVFGTVLRATMRRPLLVVAPAVVAVVVAFSALPTIGRETFPQSDEREFFVGVQQPRGTALEVTDQVARRVERILMETPGVVQVATFVGGGFGPGGSHVVNFRATLGRDAPPTQRVIADLRPRIRIPGATVFYRPLSSLFIFRTPDPISIDIRGFDLEAGNAVARQLRGVLERVPGVTDLQISREESAEEFTVQVDPLKAAGFGVSPGQVASAVRTYIGGTVATLYRAGGDDINVVVRLRESDRATPDRIGDLPISTPRGIVPLRQMATIAGTPGPTQIQRRNRERIITINGNVSGRDLGGAMADVRNAVLAQRLPRGFSVAFGGEFQDQQESFGQILSGFLMSLVLVYMVMASQFERLLEPFLIMAAVPFALVGVVGALLLTGTTLNVQSGLGAIVLVGVAVNNAIVLISYALQLQDEGIPLREALARAGARRLRPILMTTLTTICGLLPLAIGFGEGSELQSPMARAIVGGLVTSTIGSLLLIPALYVLLRSATQWVRHRREAPAAIPEATDGK